MANPKMRYRFSRHKVKKHSNNIPKIQMTEKVVVPDTAYYGNLVVLTNDSSLNVEEKYTLAMAEKEEGNFGKITILSGTKAGEVYEHVPYSKGNFNFNEYKGDSYFGVNFNKSDEQKDNTDENLMVLVDVANSIVSEQNELAAKAKKEKEELANKTASEPEF